jgi:hypothetical protein
LEIKWCSKNYLNGWIKIAEESKPQEWPTQVKAKIKISQKSSCKSPIFFDFDLKKLQSSY